jgi:hypothetical protein
MTIEVLSGNSQPEDSGAVTWFVDEAGIRSRDAQLPADLVVQLQRCDGFTARPTSKLQGTEDEHDHH